MYERRSLPAVGRSGAADVNRYGLEEQTELLEQLGALGLEIAPDLLDRGFGHADSQQPNLAKHEDRTARAARGEETRDHDLGVDADRDGISLLCLGHRDP
ncbi:MAG: hypothetical protein ACYSX0_01340 [Planctomycetota bacterium]|jgi:hypothetical protein